MKNRYKVAVYAICKNESNFVNRWYESMKEADDIYVLDTGSTDDTVNKLKKLKVKVKIKKIVPWRFDVARNIAMDMINKNTDICVCTDLDEVFNKGWRKELEKVWDKDTNRCKYIYNWSLNEDNNPIVSFYYEKIHSRNNYRWIYPVHEILHTDKDEKYVTSNKVILNHYPDSAKSRSNYLELLELSAKENPDNDRNMHYLGREYMYYKRWNECIDTLIKHLNLKSATWNDERSASMRFIARSYINLERYDEAKMWLDKAIKEAPHLRDPLVERALLDYRLSDWDNVIYHLEEALKITKHEMTYINEPFSWNNTIYDLLSIAYYYKDNKEKALYYVDIALEMEPNDKRIINNKKLIENINDK